MSSRYINSQQACPEGLRILAEQVTNFFDHRKTMELRQTEKKHLESCSICNPTLLAKNLFGGKTVVILTEVEHEN